MKGCVLLLILIFFGFYSFSQTSGDYRSNAASGNWTTVAWQKYNGSTWPAATDYPGQNAGAGTVTIRDGHNITLDVSPANAIGALVVGEGASGIFQTSNNNRTLNVTNGLTVKAGGSFNLRRITLSVGGATQVDGAVTDNNDNGSASFTGLVTVGSTGSFSTTNASAFTFKGGITNSGTLSLTGANAVAFTTNNQSLGGSGTITMDGVITVTTITVTNNNTDVNLTGTAAGTLTGTGTWKQGTNGVLNYSGSTITSAVDFNTNVNTVDYTAAGAQTVLSTTYKNLSISTSGTKTLGGAITVNGNLDISGSAVLASDIYQITGNATGTFTMASGSSLTLGNTASATNVLFPSSFTNANTTLNSASTVTYQNNSTQTVSGTPTYGNLTIATGSTKTINGNTTVAGNLTISAGTLDLGTTATTMSVTGTATVTGTLTFSGTTTKTVTITSNLSGAGTINMSGGSLLHNLNLGGANNAITTFTTAAVASTVTYNASGAQQVFGSINYRNLSTSGSGTKSMQGAVTVNNTFTIGSNTSFDPVGNSITVSGSSVFAGTLAESNTGGTNSFQSVDLSGGTINGSVTDVTNINGNLSMPTGNGTIGRTTLTVSGTTMVADGRTLTINSNTGVKTFVGAVTISGSGSWTSTTVSTTANLVLRGGIDVTSASGSFSAGGATFNTNSQNITGLGTLSFANAVTVSGAITITNTNTNGVTFSSTVDGSVAGSTWKNGASGVTYYQPAAATQPMNTGALDMSATGNYFYYSRAAAQSIKVPVSSYYHLYITGGSSATKTLQGATSVSGNFQLAASTIFDPAANNFTVSGTSTIAGTFSDGNATGTSNLQDVDLSGGTIDNASFTGIVNINTNLTMPTGNGTIGRITLTTTGTTTVATGRTLTFNANSNTGVKIFTGAITVSGTGIWTSTNITTGSNLDIRGGIDVTNSSGSFAAGAATFSTNSQSITGAGPLTFTNAVSVSGAITITNTNTYGVTFNSTVDGTAAGSTWKNGASGITYYQPGAATQPMNTGALDVSATGNYFYYSRAGTQSVKAPASSYYHLYITGGSSVIKTLQGATAVSGNLYVASSTSFDAAGFSVSVSGTTNLDGTFNDSNNSGTNTFTGLLTVTSTGTLSTANNSPFVFEGGITNNGTFSQSGTGTVSFNTNDQNIDGTATMSFAGAITIAAGKIVTYKNTNSTGITLSGVLDGANASSTWKNDVNSTVNYQPAATTQPMNTGILDVSVSGNIFYYSRTTGGQTLKAPLSAYYNLIINGGGGITKTLGGNATVNNNLTIATSTTLDVDVAQNFNLTVKGNWINSGTFRARAGTVTFNGTSNQALTSNGSSFYNLVIDNSATQVSLNDDATVSNLLTLSDGVITTGLNKVIISNSSSSSLGGYTNTSFINGNLRRYIGSNTDTYVFPVGNGTDASDYFRADMINGNLTGITYINSKFKPLAGHDDSEMNVYDNWEHGFLIYNTINTVGVWELEPNSSPGAGTYSIKLYTENFFGLTDNEFAPLKRPVGSTSGADWTTGGGTLNNDDSPGRLVADGYMQRNNLTSFSEFGAGGGSGGGAGLPIELVGFTAELQRDIVELKWITATEINNDFFTVEKSKDAISFETLAVFEGAGNSSEAKEYSTYDRTPFPVICYYRLKQTDYDGNASYSDIVSVHLVSVETSISVFPNPVRGNTFFVDVKTTPEPQNEKALMLLFDSNGKELYSEEFETSNPQQSFTLPENIKSGLYIVLIKRSGETETQRIVVE